MLRCCVLLISLLLSISSHAENVELRLSGFVTGTAFSQSDWYDNTKNIAVNVDATYEDLAIRGQIGEPYDNIIRRLVFEKSLWIKEQQEVTIQFGRFPRLDSFYNGVTDSPGTSGMAMLPLGEYNRRMVQNRTFNTVDGINAIYTIRLKSGILKLHGDYGSLPIEEPCLTQNETTKKPCRLGYQFLGDTGNYDVGASYEIGKWTYLGSMSSMRLRTELLDPKDKTSVALSTAANRVSFDLTRVGVKYTAKKWWAQSELLFTDFKLAKKDQDFTSVTTSENLYLLGGYNWTDQFNSYIEYSYSKANTGGMALDRVIGSTYVLNNTTLSLEYHNGTGLAWKKYFSETPTWDSWVFSFTQRF